MGTKISALTETGSAPTGAYYPLEYDNANYKISTETLRDSLGGKYDSGWVTGFGGTLVEDGATLSVSHNLGTSSIVPSVYVADDALGSNNVYVMLPLWIMFFLFMHLWGLLLSMALEAHVSSWIPWIPCAREYEPAPPVAVLRTPADSLPPALARPDPRPAPDTHPPWAP
mgnify:CR=1 FL=1